MDSLPRYLKRSLLYAEICQKLEQAEADDKKFVVWKCGRTTHLTFGVASGILSMYRSPNGVISDELMVKDKHLNGSDPFSKRGDSGSFIWDSQGYVVGMLWGGKEQSFVTYVTPMEAILEDIQHVCGAREAKLVVRPQEEKEAVFAAPEKAGGSSLTFESEEPQGPSLVCGGNGNEGFGIMSD
jgi:S1-C subfamily serine protease